MMTLRSLQLKFLAALVAAALFSALPALAFFPPRDARDGVTARFIGFDEGTPGGAKWKPNDAKVVLAAKRDASAPFEIRLDIANATAASVSGDLRIWMGDDWEVEVAGSRPGAQALPCVIPPHSTNSFFATAVPKPGRVLPALYPIHATFAFPGGDPLHPIAIFEAGSAPGAPAPGRADLRERPLSCGAVRHRTRFAWSSLKACVMPS